MIPFDILANPTHENVRTLCWIWLGLFGIVLWRQWSSHRAFGLPIVYAFGLTMIHLFGAWVYGFDHYAPGTDYLVMGGSSLKVTHAGFWMSTAGFAAYVLGVLICPLFFSRDPENRQNSAFDRHVTSQLPGTLFLLALVFFFLVHPITRRIPSISALGSGGIHFSVVGVFLFCHRAYFRNDFVTFQKWLGATVGFPLFTVVTMGFMSYGIAAATTIWMLTLRFFRPRWLSLLVLAVLLFSGVTAFVNWMKYREYIRHSTKSGRFEKMAEMVEDFEIFSPYKQAHLEAIDVRLNQNDFVGKAMAWTGGHNRPFARGATIWVALTAWIPRILWPGKPTLGGSGSLVSDYTGVTVSSSTSFGVGQVMEFYINFGVTSVIIGFIVFGIALTFMDQRASYYLRQGDYWNLTRWLLPALGAMQPGGSLGEAVSACAANAILAYLFHYFIFEKYYREVPLKLTASASDIAVRGSRVPVSRG